MNVITHNIEKYIKRDIQKKMVFITGPRQVGKTTLVQKIIKQKEGLYLLYDDYEDRQRILKRDFIDKKLICLDEFHKYNRWKSFIKGIYDKNKDSLNIILTGSARLDVYQKSGDSLFGRYYLYALHPLSIAEINNQDISMPENILSPTKKLNGIHELDVFGGFPEPFLSHSETEHRRWSNQRRQLLINEEFREMTHIQMLSVLENLMLLLPDKIGSLFSYNSLSEDLRVSTPTIQNWLNIFEKLYVVFKITPYTKKIIRSIQKRPKYYFWDWSQLKSEPQRFENLVASHLWKAVSIWNCLGLANTKLHYIQDRTGKESDFLVTKDEKPWFLVEVKTAEEKISNNLRYFSRRLDIPGIQLIKKSNIYKTEGNLALISADTWLGKLV